MTDNESPFRERLDKLDSPRARARLAQAVIGLGDQAWLDRKLGAAALVELASGSRELFAASLLDAVPVRRDRAHAARPAAGGLRRRRSGCQRELGLVRTDPREYAFEVFAREAPVEADAGDRKPLD
jgi:hypothetical protein